MRKLHHLSGWAAAIGMLILILDGKTALTGAKEGIDLCIRSVIPSLFPFFVLSNVLLGSLSLRWLKPLGRLLKIPGGAEGILAAGFLGGYPVGAQCIADAWKEERISTAHAHRMLTFCNNAGPSFLFGILAPQFSSPVSAWLLWAIHILSALAVAIFTKAPTEMPSKNPRQTPCSFPDALKKAVRTMALVCGWVVLFRILITFLKRWIFWGLPESWQVVFSGILELSNGCCMLSLIPSEPQRFVICAGLLSFGGVCVAMQTVSAIQGLSLRPYWRGKLFQTVISLFLAAACVWFRPVILLFFIGIGCFFPVFLRKIKNSSSNPGSVGV